MFRFYFGEYAWVELEAGMLRTSQEQCGVIERKVKRRWYNGMETPRARWEMGVGICARVTPFHHRAGKSTDARRPWPHNRKEARATNPSPLISHIRSQTVKVNSGARMQLLQLRPTIVYRTLLPHIICLILQFFFLILLSHVEIMMGRQIYDKKSTSEFWFIFREKSDVGFFWNIVGNLLVSHKFATSIYRRDCANFRRRFFV